jgi:hypothetical protein
MPLDLAALLSAMNGTSAPAQPASPSLPTPTPQPASLPANDPPAATTNTIAAPSPEWDLQDAQDDDFGVAYRPPREQANAQRRRWSRPLPPMPLVLVERPDEPARLDWWRQPVPGWREGRLFLHNIARDETFCIPLLARRSSQ